MNPDQIVALIKSEMKPSTGCTEPVAVGLAVSRACCRLKTPPTHIKITLSSNIFKNAFNVKIPNTGKCGVPLAGALGYLLANPDNTMEIFGAVTPEHVARAEALIADDFIELEIVRDSGFLIEVHAFSDGEWIHTVTRGSHDNLVKIVHDGKVLLDRGDASDAEKANAGHDITNAAVGELFDLCQTIDIDKIRFLADAIAMNREASDMGLAGEYGMGEGRCIMRMIEKGRFSADPQYLVRAAVAAGSDCRMGGGNVPVTTVVGSGNQGLISILTAATVGKILKIDEDKILRAVMMSVLVTIYIKQHVGRLSPICSAVFSGAASSAAIVWMLGGSRKTMEDAMQNMLGDLTAMLCDGAKNSCAVKLGTCAGEAVLSAWLALEGSAVGGNDGIVNTRVEDTVKSIARLSRESMSTVDGKIIEVIMGKEVGREVTERAGAPA